MQILKMKETYNLRDHPIFICGHPKSGTTLLVSLFDSHPQMLVYPNETFFFRGFLPEIKKRDLEEKLNLAQRYLLHFFERDFNNSDAQEQTRPSCYQSFFDYAKTCEIMRNTVKEYNIRHDGDILSAAIIAFGQTHGKITTDTIYWIEKSVYNEHFADRIYKWWPEARCIHIVRDPRDNYATYHRKHWGLSAEDFALGWNSSLRVGLHNREHYGKTRYLMLRYEDLTKDPETSLLEIIAFLGICDDEILRIPTYNGIPWEGNSQFGDKFRGISTKPVGRWKRELTNKEVEIIEAICADAMEEQGYEYQTHSFLKSYYYVFHWGIRQVPGLRGDISKLIKQRFGILPH